MKNFPDKLCIYINLKNVTSLYDFQRCKMCGKKGLNYEYIHCGIKENER